MLTGYIVLDISLGKGVFFFANLFTHWERVHKFYFFFLPIE